MTNDRADRSSEHMKTENLTIQGEKRILVEGPAWGDARFYGNWLLSAATANELMVSLKKNDLRISTRSRRDRDDLLSRFRNCSHCFPEETSRYSV